MVGGTEREGGEGLECTAPGDVQKCMKCHTYKQDNTCKGSYERFRAGVDCQIHRNRYDQRSVLVAADSMQLPLPVAWAGVVRASQDNSMGQEEEEGNSPLEHHRYAPGDTLAPMAPLGVRILFWLLRGSQVLRGLRCTAPGRKRNWMDRRLGLARVIRSRLYAIKGEV